MNFEANTPYKSLKYCVRCCMPETQEGIKFDELGICQACQSSEQKIHINWVEREAQLRKILENAKKNSGNNYDCIVPISGGKDSVYQLHVLVNVYKMKVLTVTFSHNWYSETGWYNLQNALAEFNVDNIMFTPNRGLVNKLANKSISAIGDACWHCHTGVGSFPLQIAARFNIPLLVWGESIAESSGRASYEQPVHRFDKDYFTKVSAKVRPDDMTCDSISKKDLFPLQVPSQEEIDKTGVFGIHLGDYIFWDEERQTEFIRERYGWRETEIEGAYKGYKSAECIMAGVHDFACYLKRGYGRATFQACIDVRNGLLTRDEGFELARKIDSQRPGALDYFLKIANMSEETFFATLKELKHKKLIDTEVNVNQRGHVNREKTIPFVEQLIDKHRNAADVRDGL